MRIITFIFFIALFCSDTFGQANVYGNNRIVYYYSLTDFSNIDTLEYWNYKLDLTNKPTENDTVKPIGLLTFYRTKSIDDSISLKTYNRLWQPAISFDIYKLSDTTFCSQKSNLLHMLSSCSPPNVGGDYFVFGNFVFLNKSVCISCSNYLTKGDYCRPVINYVFTRVTDKNVTNLNDLVKQFIIKRGQCWKGAQQVTAATRNWRFSG
jgi:hypothetical protein